MHAHPLAAGARPLLRYEKSLCDYDPQTRRTAAHAVNVWAGWPSWQCLWPPLPRPVRGRAAWCRLVPAAWSVPGGVGPSAGRGRAWRGLAQQAGRGRAACHMRRAARRVGASGGLISVTGRRLVRRCLSSVVCLSGRPGGMAALSSLLFGRVWETHGSSLSRCLASPYAVCTVCWKPPAPPRPSAAGQAGAGRAAASERTVQLTTEVTFTAGKDSQTCDPDASSPRAFPNPIQQRYTPIRRVVCGSTRKENK